MNHTISHGVFILIVLGGLLWCRLSITAPGDADGDGIDDAVDNCPTTANETQADSNEDGFGDACAPEGVTCDLVVGSTGVSHVATLGETVALASSGQTICVRAGTYSENSYLSFRVADLTIIGENKNTTILQGNGDWGIMHIGGENNTVAGFAIRGAAWGISGVHRSTIRDNIFSGNGTGLSISGSENVVVDNTFETNQHGIQVAATYDHIYHNNFIDNTVQAGGPIPDWSTWDNGEGEGNFWSDYRGSDINGDGIGDTDLPHLGLDSFPFMARDGWAGGELDSDWDGVVDSLDNCPSKANPNQFDSNEDGFGDACAPDAVFCDLVVGSTGVSHVATLGETVALTGVGQTICIRAGTYTESSVRFEIDNLTIIGEDKDSTVLQAGGGGWLLYIGGVSTTVAGFTFQGATAAISGVHLSTVRDNIFSTNSVGLSISGSDNVVNGNTFVSNQLGVEVAATNDHIFHNNFIDNIVQAGGAIPDWSTWDNGAGEGNYWSDYTGLDLDGDGIGDTNLPHLGLDSYPLMVPNAWLHDPPAIAEEQWVARYNGPGNGSDGAQALTVDGMGNVYVTGSSVGLGTETDFATIKYDTDGNQLWVARYDGPESYSDNPTAIAVDSAGHITVAGTTYGDEAGDACTTVRYDTNGNELWVAFYAELERCNVRDLSVDSAGNVYLTGNVTIKYDTNGNEVWSAVHAERYVALAVDSAGNVFVSGASPMGDTERDCITSKFDPDGEQLWTVRYNGPADSFDGASDLAVDSAGNVYVTGWGRFNPYDSDFITIKYDTQGNQQWVARYSGPDDYQNGAYTVALDDAGNIYVTGHGYESEDDILDLVTVKYDPQGVEQWVAVQEVGVANHENPNMVVDGQGNVYAISYYGELPETRDYLTVKYNTQGYQVWVATYDGPAGLEDEPVALGLDAEGNVYVSGHSPGNETGWDFATVKYATPSADLTPEEQVDAIIDHIDTSLADSSMIGTGPGKSAANKINALKNKIREAGEMIQAADLIGGCDQLAAARAKTDGVFPPPDFVEGPGAVALAELIQRLMNDLDCP
ncbi:MAG: NosD domain-containing protein [Myxococcota bacterium]|nr:NosD domain-containing protein [Myxococcota bacterium]